MKDEGRMCERNTTARKGAVLVMSPMTEVQNGINNCANCEIEFFWPPTVVEDKVYCCSGCAGGGPCCCDYSQYNAVNISGVILYGPGTKGPQQPVDIRYSGKEVYVVAKIRPVGDRVVVKP